MHAPVCCPDPLQSEGSRQIQGRLLRSWLPIYAPHTPSLHGLHDAVLLPQAVVGRLRHLDNAEEVGDGVALGDQLFRPFELADDLLGCVSDAFHGRVSGRVWTDENSHSP